MAHGAPGTPIAPRRYVPSARTRMRCAWSSMTHVPACAPRRTNDRLTVGTGTWHLLCSTVSVGPAAITILRDRRYHENHEKYPAPMARGVDDRRREHGGRVRATGAERPTGG